MVNKIVASLIFVSLLLAISIKLIGIANGVDITHVELSGPVLAFFRSTSMELENYKIAIPDIPMIPPLEDVSGAWAILQVLVNFINGFVNVLNFLVMVINTAIQLIEFLVLLIKNLIIMRNQLVPSTI